MEEDVCAERREEKAMVGNANEWWSEIKGQAEVKQLERR